MAEKTVPMVQKESQIPTREVTRHPEHYGTPLVDIFQTPDGLTVQADLPGVKNEGLGVKVENGILTIEGKNSFGSKTASEDGTTIFEEFSVVNFFRQFELPEEIDQENIKAQLKHGVLTLVLPHSEAAKPRQINVQVL